MRRALRAGVCAGVMIVAATGAWAADLAAVGAPPAQMPVWSWTGFYAGVHLGSGWANDTWRSGTGLLAGFTPFLGSGSGSGTLGGGQLGANYQIGPWVLGAEASASLAGVSAESPCGVALFICTSQIDGLGSLTGRLGFAFDQFLIYGKGGTAFEHTHDRMVPMPGRGNLNVFNGSASPWGWAAGAGVEFAFTPWLSAFAEYDYLDFGTRGVGTRDQFGNNATIATTENIHVVKGGLNYKLGQGFAPQAAGTAAFPAFAAPAPPLRWTGVYVGGHIGGGFGPTNWNSATGNLASVSSSIFAESGDNDGFLVGGQAGFNYQIGTWVTGLEADADWANIDGYAKCATTEGATPGASSSFTCHTTIDALGTLTGRLGQSFGNLLVYGKGGAAWDSEQHAATQSPAFAPLRGTDTRWGWTAGVGLEYAFSPAWSGKVEYDYVNFGNKTIGLSEPFGASSSVGLSQSLNVVKMGFNYKLGADPTSAVASAARMWIKAPVFKAPAPAESTIEAGTRYWVSGGRNQLDLYSNVGSNTLNSRLTYQGVVGQTGEAFARLDHRDGMFVKGNFGLGDLDRGSFHDEDFAPFTTPYSNTLSNQGDGRTRYGSLDVGHTIVVGPGGDLGAYVGYRYYYERQNAFGFTQLVTGEFFDTGPFSRSLLGLTETDTWSGTAVGLNTRVKLADRWRGSRRCIPALRRPVGHR
jgi:opacity protein-like surface antigen